MVETEAEARSFYSLGEVARMLGVSDRTVTRWIKAGRLPAYKPGSEWRIKGSDLEEFLEARKAAPGPQAPSLFGERAEELAASLLKLLRVMVARYAPGEEPRWSAEAIEGVRAQVSEASVRVAAMALDAGREDLAVEIVLAAHAATERLSARLRVLEEESPEPASAKGSDEAEKEAREINNQLRAMDAA